MRDEVSNLAELIRVGGGGKLPPRRPKGPRRPSDDDPYSWREAIRDQARQTIEDLSTFANALLSNDNRMSARLDELTERIATLEAELASLRAERS